MTAIYDIAIYDMAIYDIAIYDIAIYDIAIFDIGNLDLSDAPIVLVIVWRALSVLKPRKGIYLYYMLQCHMLTVAISI